MLVALRPRSYISSAATTMIRSRVSLPRRVDGLRTGIGLGHDVVRARWHGIFLSLNRGAEHRSTLTRPEWAALRPGAKWRHVVPA